MRAILQAMAAVAILTSAPAAAQLVLITNEKGKSILVKPGMKNAATYIRDKMRERGGESWAVNTKFGSKGCIAFRSLWNMKTNETRWFSATSETSYDAQRLVRDQVYSHTGGKSSGTSEAYHCNESAVDVPEYDLKRLAEEARGSK